MNAAADEAQVNEWLLARGISHSIRELEYDQTSRPDCGPELLEIFKHSLSLYANTHVASALFGRKLNRAQKQEAVRLLLEFIKQNREKWGTLSMLVWNELHDNVNASHVHEIAQLATDKDCGPLRGSFTNMLGKIANADAISYLLRDAKDAATATMALRNLARLRVEGTLELCAAALDRTDLDENSQTSIKETRNKLARQLAKNPYATSHLMTEPLSAGLPETSINLDSCDLGKWLRKIQPLVTSGFGKPEVLELTTAADDLDLHEARRFKFSITFADNRAALYLEMLGDGEDAVVLTAFGPQALISQLEHMWRD